MPEPPSLTTVLGDHAFAAPIRRGTLASGAVRFDFQPVGPIHRAFAPMVRDQAYDLCELAVVTCLQAVAYQRPIAVLPIVVTSRFQRGCIVGDSRKGPLAPETLADKRIGVRAYTQTTGMWVRAHLAEDYGLPIRQMRWITQESAHVAEFSDPSIVEHVGHATRLPDMLQQGVIDAVIMGNDLPTGEGFAPIIQDAQARDLAWWARHRFMPINHMLVVGTRALARHPGAVRAAYRLVAEAEAAARPPAHAPSRTLSGFERLRAPIELTIAACLQQGLLPRALTFEEVFAPARAVLGDCAS